MIVWLNQYFLKGTSIGFANFNSPTGVLGYFDISSYFNIFLWLLTKIYVILPVIRFNLSNFNSAVPVSFYLITGQYS